MFSGSAQSTPFSATPVKPALLSGPAVSFSGDPQPESLGVRHAQDAFSPFVQYVRPLPPRSSGQFYAQSFQHNALHAYHNSFNRYLTELKENPRERTRLTLISGALALAATAFRRHHQFVEGVFLSLFITYPVISTLNILPRVREAYALEKSGEPDKAQRTFKKSLESLFYTMFQKYFRPLTVAFLLFYPALNFKRAPLKSLQQLCRWGARKLGNDPQKLEHWPKWLRGIHQGAERLGNTRPVLWLDRQTNRIGNWGDKLLQPLERWFDRFKF